MMIFTSISALGRSVEGKEYHDGIFQLKTIVKCSWGWLLPFSPPHFGKDLCKIGVHLLYSSWRCFSLLMLLRSHPQLIRMRNYHLVYKQVEIGKLPSD